MGDYYSTLGISRFASQDAIKRAFRSRIRTVHPDRHPDDDTAPDRARKVIEAYEVLHDPATRRQYDRTVPTRAHAMPAYRYRDPGCPQWLTRAVLLVLFFAVSAGLFYMTMMAFTDNTPVYRPDLGAISVSTQPASPAMLQGSGTNEDRGSGLHVYSMKQVPNPGPRVSLAIR